MLTEVGSAGGFGTANTNTASFRVSLVPQAERQRSSQEIARALRPPLGRFPGVIARVRTGSGNFLARLTQGSGNRLAVDVRGYQLDATYDLAVQVKRLMESTDGVSDAVVSRSPGRPETSVLVDRHKAATLGLSVADLATNLRTSFGGTTATFLRERGEEYDIVVRYAESQRQSLEDVLAVPVRTPEGNAIPLSSLVKLERNEGPISIARKDQQRIVTVSGNLTGTRDMGSIVADLQEKFHSLQLPSDTAVLFSGEWEEQRESFRVLLLGLVLAVILVYLVMAAQFESFKSPFLIMFSLPLAAVGVILALFLTHTTFSMQAFIGIIMLAGIVVNNAIVLVDRVLQLRRIHDYSLVDALVTGGRHRLRPILMTTLTTVLGLVPMAMGMGEGGELQAPMGRVLIGGLLSSTLITLFFIPTLYYATERQARRREAAPDPEAAVVGAGLAD